MGAGEDVDVQANETKDDALAQTAVAEGPPEEDARDPAVVIEEAREEALDFLEGLLEVTGLEGSIEVLVEEEWLRASMSGPDMGVLIGRRGQTLEAVQELLRSAVQHGVRARVRVSLDIEGYRSRRAEAVEKLAGEMAQKALRVGEVELEAMSAFERKIVHDTVSGIEGVISFSEGEEPRRRVIIQAQE